MKLKFLLLFSLSVSPFCFLNAQSTDLLPNSELNHLIDRIDIKGLTGEIIHTDVRPFNRAALAQIFEGIDMTTLPAKEQDWINRMRLLADDQYALGKLDKGILKYFYKNDRDLFSINKENFNIYINPVLYFAGGWDQSTDSSGASQGLLNYRNTRGVQVRGDLFGKIGFFTEVTENQYKAPQFVRNNFAQNDALPGEGFVKVFDDTSNMGGSGFDYLTSRAYLTYSPFKFLRIKFGKDRAFWGNGYQSLFLSDFSTDHLMLDLNAKFWQLEYTYHLAQLVHYIPNKPDGIGTFPRKYATFHMLSWKPNPRISISAFESVVYSPTLPGDYRGLELEYLNPIIFFRTAEQFIGSPDNSVLGAQVKVNFLKRFQGYGQLLIDDFNFRNRANGTGYWGNKIGYQLGMKWIDAFFVPRLDLQLEYNRIRPFTYSHFNPAASYSHYGQFLAHAQGANLWDFNIILRYQPWPRWSGQLVVTTLTKGEDINGVNYGGNPLRSYIVHVQDYNNVVGQGMPMKINSVYGRIAFQPFKNDFRLEGEMRLRKDSYLTSASIMAGMRLGIPNKPIKF